MVQFEHKESGNFRYVVRKINLSFIKTHVKHSGDKLIKPNVRHSGDKLIKPNVRHSGDNCSVSNVL